MNLKSVIRTVPNFPKEGIDYIDVTSILEDPRAFQYSVDRLVQYCADKVVTDIVAPDARGFLWAAPVALELGVPLHIARKPNKLPGQTIRQYYTYEYDTSSIELRAKTPVNENSNVVIIDDVSATGGTAMALTEILRSLEVIDIQYACVVDLKFLGGTQRLNRNRLDTFSVVTYDE